MGKFKNFYSGEFWFSDDVENKKPGYIRKNDNGKYELRVFDSFDKKTVYTASNYTEYAKDDRTILGKIIAEDSLSLLGQKNITLMGVGYYDSGLPIVEYSFDYLVFDYHFPSSKDAVFFNVIFTFDGLAEFIGQSSFGFEIHQSRIKTKYLVREDKNQVKATYDLGDTIIIFRSTLRESGGHAHFDVRDVSYSLLDRISMENQANIELEFGCGKTINEIDSFLEDLRDFFSLNFQKLIKVRNVNLFRKESVDSKEIDFSPSIIFNTGHLFNVGKIVEKKNVEMLFNLQSLKGTFSDIFLNRLSNRSSSRIHNIYFNLLGRRTRYVESDFLNVVQAIEGMGCLFVNDLVSEKTRTGIKEKIKASGCLTKKEIKDYVSIKKYKYSLETKLLKIAGKINFSLSDISDYLTFYDIVELRNQLSHGADLTSTPYDIYDQYKVCKMFLELIMMYLMGFSEDLYESIKDYKISNLKRSLS